jgi:hypothetical protein
VRTTEANAQRAEIIATLYTVSACANTAVLADSSKVKVSLLGTRDQLIVDVGCLKLSRKTQKRTFTIE